MKKTLILTLTGALILVTPTLAFAEETVTPRPTTEARGAAREAATADRITLIKTKADQEIARRIASINELITRIQGLKRLADSDKTNLVGMANSMIANLNTLKTKIDGDTDITTLRADQKSIFDQYRIYMLFMPQLRIYVAADRIDDTADLMTTVAGKLATRINGNTTLQTTLNDANAKIADAKTQAQNAINAIKRLTPDGGNDGIASSNKQALLSAKNFLMAATTDLQTARHDFATIIAALKEAKASPSASPTPTATP